MGFNRSVNTILAYRTMRAVEEQQRHSDPKVPRTRWQRWQDLMNKIGDKAAGVK